MRHRILEHLDWIESGTFSPWEPLERISERASVKSDLIHGFQDSRFQMSDFRVSRPDPDSEVRSRVSRPDPDSEVRSRTPETRYRTQRPETRYREQEPRPSPGPSPSWSSRHGPSWSSRHGPSWSSRSTPPWVHLPVPHGTSRHGTAVRYGGLVVESVVGLNKGSSIDQK